MNVIKSCKNNVSSRDKQSYESILILHNMRNNICNITFMTYRKYNPIVNGIIFFSIEQH